MASGVPAPFLLLCVHSSPAPFPGLETVRFQRIKRLKQRLTIRKSYLTEAMVSIPKRLGALGSTGERPRWFWPHRGSGKHPVWHFRAAL